MKTCQQNQKKIHSFQIMKIKTLQIKGKKGRKSVQQQDLITVTLFFIKQSHMSLKSLKKGAKKVNKSVLTHFLLRRQRRRPWEGLGVKEEWIPFLKSSHRLKP